MGCSDPKDYDPQRVQRFWGFMEKTPMLKSYPRLYATIVLAAMILAGCSTPAKNIVRVDYAEQAKNIRTIGILAPDVDYYDVSLGGVREKNDEETDVVRANVTEALKAGYSIELDIHATKDRQLVISHDTTMDRIAGRLDKVTELTLQEIKQIGIINDE